MMRLKRVLCWVLALTAAKNLPAQVSADGINYVNTYKALAMSEMQRSGIPAAIILAQGLHESEAGNSELVRKSNNHFGIKCRDDWKGDVVYHDDDSRGECFRSYASAEDSYKDHSEFLRRSTRYAFLFNLDPSDYEGWAYGLKKAGYATNIKYSQILIKLVQNYNLQQYTLIGMGKMKPSEEVVLVSPGGVPVLGGGADVGSGGTASGGAGGGGAVGGNAGQGSGNAGGVIAPEVAYPQGAFTINRTRVVYVQAGVSLLSIANQYEIPLGRLLDFNDMREEDVLNKDQLIFLQRKRRTGVIDFHVVREGENVYDICQSEGVRLQDLLEMNQLTPGARPAAGEKIYLQSSAPSRPRLEEAVPRYIQPVNGNMPNNH
jgi:Mannosyl-glycoprotein endo-beta-N-acetylglucosaminidase/LysM domain